MIIDLLELNRDNCLKNQKASISSSKWCIRLYKYWVLIINAPVSLRNKMFPLHFLDAYNHRRAKFTWGKWVWRVTEQHHSFPFFHSDLRTFLGGKGSRSSHESKKETFILWAMEKLILIKVSFSAADSLLYTIFLCWFGEAYPKLTQPFQTLECAHITEYGHWQHLYNCCDNPEDCAFPKLCF